MLNIVFHYVIAMETSGTDSIGSLLTGDSARAVKMGLARNGQTLTIIDLVRILLIRVLYSDIGTRRKVWGHDIFDK